MHGLQWSSYQIQLNKIEDKSLGVFGWCPGLRPAPRQVDLTLGDRNQTPGVAAWQAPTKQAPCVVIKVLK